MSNYGTKQRVENLLTRIVAGDFTEQDIGLLLISLRAEVRDSLLREVANFVAHPEGRNRGLSHDEIELQAFKMERATNRLPPIEISIIDQRIMKLWLLALDQVSEGNIVPISKITPQQAISLVKRAYMQREDGRYYLRQSLKQSDLVHVFQLAEAGFGLIHVRPLVTQKRLISEIQAAISRLGVSHGDRYLEGLAAHASDVMLCILCELQHAEIVLAKRRATLSWGPELQSENKDPSCARLCLLCSFGSPLPNGNSATLVFPFATTEVALCDVLPDELANGSELMRQGVFLRTERRGDGTLRLIRA